MQHFTDQIALTVIDEIDENFYDKLESKLNDINKNVEDNQFIPFKNLNGLHFCRFVILPGFTTYDGKIIPTQLAYSSNFDDSLDTHIDEIIQSGTLIGYASVFRHCLSYDKTLPDNEAVAKFIKSNQKKVHTFYRGYRGLTVSIIKEERAQNKSIQTFLDANNLSNITVPEIKNKIYNHIQEQFPDRVHPIEPGSSRSHDLEL